MPGYLLFFPPFRFSRLPNLCLEKSLQVRHVLLPLVHMGKVSSVLQCNPLHLLNMIKKRLHSYILSFVFCSIDQEGRSSDASQQLGDTGPVAKRARDVKLTGAVPETVVSLLFVGK